ncbi:Hypothetical protein D9617_19g101670 [Elsinoe fawcettii]|nr:Hypothetical protein D9617_19g101670 [Elsinoe fawcettii]
MYPNPGQTGQWSPNPPPPSSSAGPQQGQQQWAPPPQQQQGQPQPNGQYRGPPPNQIPPITQGQHPQAPAMQTLQPQHPDQYRSLPPPGPMYAHSPYHPQPPIQYPPQPAPRQRTAIACRYCRRRKIRCSGFDQSEDGRCTNCQRFSQECIFTPVSQQTQAFVPAHAVMRNQGQMPPQLYGAYGQPLPQGQYGYPPQYAPQPPNGYQYPPQHQPPMQGQPGQQPPPQQGMAPPNQQMQQSPQQQPPQAAGQKRPNEEPHTPTHAPPNPANNAQIGQNQQRSASGEQIKDHEYPDLSSLTQVFSPASSNQQPYYPTNGNSQQGHHATPPQNNNYTHEAQPKQERINSASPQVANNPGGYPAPTSDPNLRPPHTGQDGTTGNQAPSSPAQPHQGQAQGQAQTAS